MVDVPIEVVVVYGVVLVVDVPIEVVVVYGVVLVVDVPIEVVVVYGVVLVVDVPIDVVVVIVVGIVATPIAYISSSNDADVVVPISYISSNGVVAVVVTSFALADAVLFISAQLDEPIATSAIIEVICFVNFLISFSSVFVCNQFKCT